MGLKLNRSPAFQFYPDKYLAGTDHLTDAACRAYTRVMAYMWLHAKTQCSMPDTVSTWRRATRIDDADKLAAVRAEIQDPECPMLREAKGRNGAPAMLICDGLRKESEKQRATRTERIKAARVRWERELQRKTNESKSNANASDLQSSPSPSPSPATLILEREAPPTPQRGAGRPRSRLTQADKQRLKVKDNTPLMSRLGGLMRRHASTHWSIAEAEALAQLGDVPEADLVLVEAYYAATMPKENDYRRTSLITILNNWQTEVDRARKHAPDIEKAKRAEALKKEAERKEAAERSAPRYVESIWRLVKEGLDDPTRENASEASVASAYAKLEATYGAEYARQIREIVDYRKEQHLRGPK